MTPFDKAPPVPRDTRVQGMEQKTTCAWLCKATIIGAPLACGWVWFATCKLGWL
jgi:hypothetical protein